MVTKGATPQTGDSPGLFRDEPSLSRLRAVFPDVITPLLAVSAAKLSFLTPRKLQNTKNTPLKVAVVATEFLVACKAKCIYLF